MDIRYSFSFKKLNRVEDKEDIDYVVMQYYEISFRVGEFVRPFKLYGTGKWDDSKWTYFSLGIFDMQFSKYVDYWPIKSLSSLMNVTKGLKINKNA